MFFLLRHRRRHSIQMAVQIDSRPWLVIFINENGIVATVMDSVDFIDVVKKEARRSQQSPIMD